MEKTIVFCNDIDHAERMRRALANCNPEQMAKNEKYVMKITGDDEIGKAQLDNFINPKRPYPVIATTSKQTPKSLFDVKKQNFYGHQ